MDQVARLPLGGRRYQPYAKTLRFVGVDLTGALFRMQVRMLPNTPGAPLLALQTVTSGAAEGIRLIGVEQVDGKPVSTVGIRVNKTSMQALPYAGELGDDSVFAYDLMVNPAGGLEQVWLAGVFVAQAGVTGADNAAPTFSSGVGIRSIAVEAGASSFQIGDTIVAVTIGPGEGPPGQRGLPGAAGNVAVGRDALVRVQASAGDVWFLSDGARSGNFVHREGASPADALQGIFIASQTANRYWERIWDGITGHPEWFGAAPNTGADALPAIYACMRLCPVTELANADYFIFDTWKWTSEFSRRRVYGCEGSYEDRGFGTRVILTGARAVAGATIQQVGNDNVPAWQSSDVVYRPIAEGYCLVRDAASSSGNNVSFLDQPKGLVLSYMLEGHFRRIKSIGSPIGVRIFGCVNTEVEFVHAHCGAAASAACHFLIGSATPIFGFAGSNATLHLRRCTATGNPNNDSNTRAMMLFGCYVDTFIHDFETATVPYGIVLDGTDLVGNNVTTPSGQGDVYISHPILDQVSKIGINIYRQNSSGSLDIVSPYVAPSSGGIGVYIYESTGSTRILGGQVLGAAGVTGTTGLQAVSSQGIFVDGLDCRDTVKPLLLTATGSSELNLIARNLTVKAAAAFQLDGCYRMKLSGIITGAAKMFDVGASLLPNCGFVHVDPSSYNPGAFTTVNAAYKVLFDGQDASVTVGKAAFEAAGCRLSGVLG